MSTPPPLRLESIHICGYRAFPRPVEIPPTRRSPGQLVEIHEKFPVDKGHRKV